MNRRQNESGWTSAQTLSEALPFIQRYTNKTLIIKFGGHAMGDAKLTEQFARDAVLLKQFGIHPIIVHGGGPQIGTMLSQLGIESDFIDGMRISDRETVNVAEMVLSATINKSIVAAINQAGGRAVGLSGRDGGLITAEMRRKDLGFAGTPIDVNITVLDVLTRTEPGFIPVISPISSAKDGTALNVNADMAAGVLAGAMKASRLMLLTDVQGVMDQDGTLLTDLSTDSIDMLIEKNIAQGGMIPKLKTAQNAIYDGVEAVVILDGRRAHGLLVELFTDQGAGTLIRS